MFETMLLPVSLHFINSIFSGIYAGSFLQGKYRKKTTLAIWGAIYFSGQIAVFEILGGRVHINDIAGVILDIGILFFLQLLLFDRILSKQIFVILSFMAGKEIIKYMVSVFGLGFNGLWSRICLFLLEKEIVNTAEKVHVLGSVSAVAISVTEAFLYALLLALYLRLISRKFVKKDYRLQRQENAFLFLPSVAALCISIAMKIMIVTVENGMTILIYDTVPETKFWIPVVCLLLLAAITANVMLFQKLVQYHEEAGKRLVLEKQVQQMQNEVAEIQDIYADMRGLRHDMRNHLFNIRLYVKSIVGTDSEELNRYIGNMEETVSRLDFTYQTGNPITDIIVHQKSQEARKKKIQFDVDFLYPSEQKIDAYDIGVVLDNALENAIEACSRAEACSKGEECSRAEVGKYIYLHSCVKGNLFFIEVENSFTGEIKFDGKTGLPVSSKEDKRLHGFGISNIQKCAKKYMGDIDIAIFTVDGKKKFSLTVMMNGKPAAV